MTFLLWFWTWITPGPSLPPPTCDPTSDCTLPGSHAPPISPRCPPDWTQC